jgi:hypothetical protein
MNRTALRGESAAALRCRRKFLLIFPGGFRDPEYIELERDYKWQSPQRWLSTQSGTFRGAAARAGMRRSLPQPSRWSREPAEEGAQRFIAQPLKHIFLTLPRTFGGSPEICVPPDYIELQSFIWVIGSEEYED